MTTEGEAYLHAQIDKMTFADSLDAILHDELDTEEGYAEKLGYSMRKLNSYATGKKVPEITDVLHMAEIIGYSPEVWVKLWVNDRLRDAGANFQLITGQIFQARAKKKVRTRQSKRREEARKRQEVGNTKHKA